MKQLLLLILVTPFLLNGQSIQTVDTLEVNQMEYRGKLGYKIGTDIPFTGILIIRYSNGNKMEEESYAKGKTIGKTGWAYLDGLTMISKYVLNQNTWEVISQTNYNSNGQKLMHIDYKNGKETNWYEDGKIKEEESYGNNTERYRKIWDHNGDEIIAGITKPKDTVDIDALTWKGYTPYVKGNPKVFTGVVTLSGEYDYRNFRLNENNYYSIINFVFGKLNGPYTIWYQKDGQKKSEMLLLDDPQGYGIKLDGPYTEWYENGQLKTKGTFYLGDAHHLQTTWYKNGLIESKKTYNRGDLDGRQAGWYKNGKMAFETTYFDDKIIKNIEWDENGNKVKDWPETDRDNFGLRIFLDEFVSVLKTRNYDDIKGLIVNKEDFKNLLLFYGENDATEKEFNDFWPEYVSESIKKIKKQVDDDFLFVNYFENGTITNVVYDYDIINDDKSSLSLKWPESINYDIASTIYTYTDLTLFMENNEEPLTIKLKLMYLNNKWCISPIVEGLPIYVKY